MTIPSTRRARRWPWIAVAVLLAVLLFVKDFAVELLAPSFQPFFAAHPKLVWGVLLTGFVAALVIAVWEFIKPDAAPEPSAAPPAQSPAPSKVKHVHHHYAESSETVFSPLHQLPEPPTHFTGRADELAQLEQLLAQGSACITGVRGMGGVGKTALAYALGARVKARYPDAQFLLDMQGVSAKPQTVADALTHVIRSLRPELGQLPDDEAALQTMYLSLLDRQRALIVFDNAPSGLRLERLRPPSGCALLVTSRFQFAGLDAVNLEALPPDKARELLLSLTPRIGAEADELARLCGYLPLALRLVAGALQVRDDLTPTDYARRLKEKRLTILDEVEATLALSYDWLDAAEQLRWRALAVFPAAFDRRAAAAVWEMDDTDEAQDALAALRSYSLLEYDAGRWRMHDLARLFADAQLTNDERTRFALRHATHYCSVLAEAKELYEQGGAAVVQGLNLFDQERDHIEAGQAWAATRSNNEQLNDKAAAQLCAEFADAGVYVLSLRLHPRKQIHWLESQLAAARRLQLREDEGNAVGNLGLAYAALGDTRQAITYHEQALVISREIGDRRGEGSDLGSLGNAYSDLGETRQAITYYEQALVIAREIGDRRVEGSALGNLGSAYADLGEVRKAITYYEQSLVIAREIGNHQSEGNALWNLALALDKLDERAQAIAHAEASLKIFEEIESPKANKVRQGLAKFRSSFFGRLRLALAMWRRSS